MSSDGHKTLTRLARYKDTLQIISIRTGTSLSSLIISFTILHEVTAIVSLAGVFWGARTMGTGESLVNYVVGDAPEHDGQASWATRQLKFWFREGEMRAERVGRRYGIFGFEKYPQSTHPNSHEKDAKSAIASNLPGKLAGDVACAVLAYGVTKTLMPLRIGLSLYLTPLFSRRVIDPVRVNIFRFLQQKTPSK